MVDHDHLLYRLRTQLDNEFGHLRSSTAETGGVLQEAEYGRLKRALLEYVRWSDSKLALMVQRGNLLHDLGVFYGGFDFDAEHLHRYDYESVADLYVSREYYTARHEALNVRLRQDHEDYMAPLLEQGTGTMIKNAEGIALRLRVLAFFETPSLDIESVDVLLAVEHPLDAIMEHHFAEDNDPVKDCIPWTIGTLRDQLLHKDFSLAHNDVYDYYDNHIPDPKLLYHIEANCSIDATARALLLQVAAEYRAAYYQDTDRDLLFGMQSMFNELADHWPFSDPHDAAVLYSLPTPLAEITARANSAHIKPGTAIRNVIAARRRELESWMEPGTQLMPEQRNALVMYIAHVRSEAKGPETLEDECQEEL